MTAYLERNPAGSLEREQTGDDVTEYTWNAEEMLERVDLPSGLSNYFDYDGDARRWSKRDSDGLKRYLWDATPSGEPGLAVVLNAPRWARASPRRGGRRPTIAAPWGRRTYPTPLSRAAGSPRIT